MSEPLTKSCVVCGRTMQWRKKWARTWEQVRYCSAACRRQGLRPIDLELESAILFLLANQPRGTRICASEAAHFVGGSQWESLIEPGRAAARRLSVEGKVEITQSGRRTDPSTAKGPIQIGLL
ncbi:MAG: DUF2256 and DUF3253 domain-containing protein [Acidimicrobiales bacterium]